MAVDNAAAMHSKLPLVGIVVLNYNGAAKTLNCVQSLQQLNYAAVKIVVVDNASTDDSKTVLQQQLPNTVHFIAHATNGGYSAGNNVGIQWLQQSTTPPEYFWVLNNDTIVDENALTALVEQGQRYPQSLIGSVLKYPDSRFQRVGSYLTPLKTKLKDYKEHAIKDGDTVESLSGCSWLISQQAITQLGLLPEDYFLYFEDNDYCFKAKAQGWQCRVALNSVVFHEESATTSRQPDVMAYYFQRNRLMFLKRWVNPLQFVFVWAYTLFRLWRAHFKTNQAVLPFKLAVQDFKAGITGQCPHVFK